jgi:hypothetical protein
MDSTSGVDISMSGIRSTSSITVNPFLPVAGSMCSLEILKIVGYGNSLGLDGAEEVLHYGIGVIAEGH